MTALSQSLTVSQAGGDFVATNVIGDPYILPEKGLAYPDFEVRLGYLPDNPDVAGSSPNSATLGVGTLPLQIAVTGTSSADLQTKRRALEAAFGQFSYTVTIEVGGQTETYDAFMAWPKWGAVDSGDAAKFLALATLSVPVNPMGA
jgi:hypothetical protein